MAEGAEKRSRKRHTLPALRDVLFQAGNARGTAIARDVSLGGILLDVFSGRPWIHWSVIAALSVAAAGGFFALRFRVPPKADLG